MIKNTVAIAFNAGAYGTYLEWCLYTLTSNGSIQFPFRNNGNSHEFRGQHLENMQGWRSYYTSPVEHQFVRLHPKTLVDESIDASLQEIVSQTQNLVYLYPDQHTLLLCLNNFFYKIWDNWFVEFYQTILDVQKIYTNWPVDPHTPIDQIPRWIMREFLSHYLMPAWLNQIEWNHGSRWQHPKSITVTVSQLLFDFEKTLGSIQRFCNLEFNKPASALLEAHETNLQLQKYINHDRVCRQIIDSVVTQDSFTWSELSLPSEAWIQWQLRNQGFEIRCHELNSFPTNSDALRDLIYA